MPQIAIQSDGFPEFFFCAATPLLQRVYNQQFGIRQIRNILDAAQSELAQAAGVAHYAESQWRGGFRGHLWLAETTNSSAKR
jgi:hypothetical protein